jgi:hypothetical protein
MDTHDAVHEGASRMAVDDIEEWPLKRSPHSGTAPDARSSLSSSFQPAPQRQTEREVPFEPIVHVARHTDIVTLRMDVAAKHAVEALADAVHAGI